MSSQAKEFLHPKLAWNIIGGWVGGTWHIVSDLIKGPKKGTHRLSSFPFSSLQIWARSLLTTIKFHFGIVFFANLIPAPTAFLAHHLALGPFLCHLLYPAVLVPKVEVHLLKGDKDTTNVYNSRSPSSLLFAKYNRLLLAKFDHLCYPKNLKT